MTDDPLEVVVITVDEYFYIPKFLSDICESDHIHIECIVGMPPSLGMESLPRFALKLLDTFGPRVFVQHGLFYSKYLLLDSLFRVLGRGKPHSPKSMAGAHGIDYHHVEDVNSEEFIEFARSKSPEVIASVAATQKFGLELIQIPSRGAVNIHSSLLPEYRGVSPSFWTLLNDEERTGISVHYMDDELDTGDLIRQREIEIRPSDSQHSLNSRIANQGSGILLDALEDIRTGSVDTTPIDSAEGSYYSMPEREDVREFLDKGKSFY